MESVYSVPDACLVWGGWACTLMLMLYMVLVGLLGSGRRP